MLDAIYALLSRVRLIEGNPGPNREDVSELREDVNTLLESKTAIAHDMDLSFSHVDTRLNKVENPPH